MKTTLVLAVILAISTASPWKSELQFRNLYVDGPHVQFSGPSGRIIGGQVAPAHSIPYQVFMEVYSSSSGWYCGGSLISRNYVLTAGHCGHQASRAELVLGAQRPQDKENTQVRLTSSKIIVHPQFNMDSILNDIALIKLPQSVTPNQYVAVVHLPSTSDLSNSYAGQTGKVSGWGLTSGNSRTISKELRYVQNPILSNSQCSSQMGLKLKDYQVCLSGANGHSSCQGDSGGPLTVNGVQVGVVSFGLRGCPTGAPSAYTRTTSFLSWIKSNSDV